MKKEIHKAYQPLAFEDESMLFNIVITWFIVIDQSDFYRLPVIAEVEKKKKKLSRLIHFQCSSFWFEVFWETSSVFLKAPRGLFTKLQRRSHIDPLYGDIFWWCNNSSSSLWF